ncbi:MAG: protein phosphatase 2C domain-containing protein [Pseudomonadota bacterium]
MIGRTFTFETGSKTHTGLKRDNNEDRLLSEPDSGLWLVADGMGGHVGGAFASGSIVDHLSSIGKPSSAPDLQARFVERISRANGDILKHAANTGGTIGSTVVALLTFEQHFACVWSGDSRVYMIRDDQFMMLSRDHTEVNELLDRGAITEEEAENWPRKNVITRAVGVGNDVALDHRYGTLRDRDTFILCSDGLTAHVPDADIFDVARNHEPQAACDRLLEITLDRGATDNVSIIVVRADDRSAQRATM